MRKAWLINMQQNQLMKNTAVYTLLFAVCALVIIFYYCVNEVEIVMEDSQEDIVQSTDTAIRENSDDKPENIQSENSIIFEKNDQEMTYFCVPLHEDVRAENVTIENHYMDKELWISIDKEQNSKKFDDFYHAHGVYGNRDAVVEGYFENSEDAFRLKFKLADIYEYHSIFENNNLYIEFVSPKEVYDKIVVIDPAYGGEIAGAVSGKLEGKKITLEIARALKEKLDETDIKVYYTRMDDSAPSDDNRIDLTNAVKADMLIRIEVSEDEDTKKYGTEAVYNSKFFIPGFGSVELADLLEKEVVTAISGKANGLLASTAEDEVIEKAVVPAAAIRVGYVSNGQEAILLNREDYIQKIADGIYQAILLAYEE
ncbi:MAG: N-acetylmuramoyl-L-alanine amidase [Lachnospiraceae bacterium]|nr:N-acetylmuramoyl-L-alanine amidase [Lachnospiraceae bacterium]